MAPTDLKPILWGTGRPLGDARAVLQRHNIPCSVDYESDERGYRLSVPAQHVDAALRILAAGHSTRLLSWIFRSAPTGPIACPTCGAVDRSRRLPMWVIVFAVGIIALVTLTATFGISNWPFALFWTAFLLIAASQILIWSYPRLVGRRTCRSCGSVFPPQRSRANTSRD